MPASFANGGGSTEERGLRWARVRVPAAARERRRPRASGETQWPTRATARTPGKIVEIKGVVLDAVFPDRLPEIFHALSIEIPEEDGGSRELIAEVQQHLGDDRVRAVAMDSTDGLARGVEVVDTQQPISVPGRRPDARPHLERDRRPRRRQGGREGRALADPPRSAALRRSLAGDRDLRDRASRSST